MLPPNDPRQLNVVPQDPSHTPDVPTGRREGTASPRQEVATSKSAPSDSDSTRLVPYRLDTPTHYRLPVSMPVFDGQAQNHLLPKTRAGSSASVGILSTTRAPPSGDHRSNDRESMDASRQPRSRGQCRPTGVEVFDKFARRGPTLPAPRDLHCENRCGSTIELLDAMVDVRGRRRVATASTRPARTTQSARNPTPLASPHDKPFGFARRRSLRRPAATTEAATNPHLAGCRPDYRPPTEHLAGDTSAAARRSLHVTPHNPFRSGLPRSLESPRTSGEARSRQRITQRTG